MSLTRTNYHCCSAVVVLAIVVLVIVVVVVFAVVHVLVILAVFIFVLVFFPFLLVFLFFSLLRRMVPLLSIIYATCLDLRSLITEGSLNAGLNTIDSARSLVSEGTQWGTLV